MNAATRLLSLDDYMAFAGVVSREGGKVRATSSRAADRPVEATAVAAAGEKCELQKVDSDLEEFTFILDPRRKRKVVVRAPHDLTKKELARIRAWMEIQLISDEGEEPAATQ